MANSAVTDSIIGLIRGKLISQHYLTNQLPSRDDWKTAGGGARATEIEVLFERVRPQLSKNKPASKGSNEDAVRGHLLNYVFEILGLRWSPGVHYFLGQLDYVLGCFGHIAISLSFPSRWTASGLRSRAEGARHCAAR